MEVQFKDKIFAESHGFVPGVWYAAKIVNNRIEIKGRIHETYSLTNFIIMNRG